MVKDITIDARDLGFDSWACQIEHGLANAATFCVAQVLCHGNCGLRHLGAKCVAAHFSQLFFYYFQKILLTPFLQKIYICNRVSVLIFSNFLITASNKQTS